MSSGGFESEYENCLCIDSHGSRSCVWRRGRRSTSFEHGACAPATEQQSASNYRLACDSRYQDQPYSFAPSATDPDGDPLTFSISNLPAWASFDSATGSLTGTPGVARVGTTLDVTISVSDGTASASSPPFDLEVQAVQLGVATVSWDIPTTNADGSALTDLDGFNVHYGEASQAYTRLEVVSD